MPASTAARRPLCAICDKTNTTVRLCRPCRTDPANAGWSDRPMFPELATLDPHDDGDRRAVALDARARLAELQDRKARPLAERTRQILQLVGFYQVRDWRRPEGRLRARCEWIEERRPLTLPEVAFLVGVSTRSVVDTLRRFEPLMRTAIAAQGRLE